MSCNSDKIVFYEISPEEGFFEMERDIWGPFLWSGRHFKIKIPADKGLYGVRMCYYRDNGKLTLKSNGNLSDVITLNKGWNTYPFDFSGLAGNRISSEVNPTVAVPGEARDLGVMIRRCWPLKNRSVLDSIKLVMANKIINDREYEEGRTILESYPSKLRINTAVRCNMNPHCAYCDWDRTKTDELESDFKFSFDTLKELGGFYSLAEEVVDNSYGEPLLNEDFWKFADEFDGRGKLFEVGSNGLLLTKENRQRLLGKNMVLYISADAASKAGYKRYRNEKFDLLIENLRSLCSERKEYFELPKVIMSFVAMRSNISEIGPFLDLMKTIGVDGTKIIYLDVDPSLQRRKIIHNGYHFNYNAEQLSLRELQDLDRTSKEIAAAKGAHLINRLDFAAEERKGEGPVCSEPWKNIHVLDRGIVACLFSRTTPVARWSERENRPLEQFVMDVWNGRRYREIRDELASGRLPGFCMETRTCPLVRKTLNA